MRKILKVPLPAKKCDLCQDPIGLYQPWYSIVAYPHCTKLNPERDIAVLCPNCFRAYETFLTEHQMRTTHAKEIQESMHPEK